MLFNNNLLESVRPNEVNNCPLLSVAKWAHRGFDREGQHNILSHIFWEAESS